MKALKNKLFKVNLANLIIAIVIMICNFIPCGDDLKTIFLILTSMNTGVILFNWWLGFQLKKIKYDV